MTKPIRRRKKSRLPNACNFLSTMTTWPFGHEVWMTDWNYWPKQTRFDQSTHCQTLRASFHGRGSLLGHVTFLNSAAASLWRFQSNDVERTYVQGKRGCFLAVSCSYLQSPNNVTDCWRLLQSVSEYFTTTAFSFDRTFSSSLTFKRLLGYKAPSDSR